METCKTCGNEYESLDLENIVSPMYQEFDGEIPEMEKKCLSCRASLEEVTMTIREFIVRGG